jgi:glycosyltransferase 2 family protein
VSGRRRVLLAWGVAILCLPLVYLAFRDVDFDQFWDALRTSDYVWVLPAFAVLVVTVVLRGLRWRFLFPPETRPPTGPTMEALLVGYFFNSILPLRAGEVIRVVVLHQRAGTSRVEALATTVADRVYDVGVLLVLLFVTLPFLPGVDWLRQVVLFALLFGVLLAVTIAVLLLWGERAARVLVRPLRYLPGFTAGRTDAAARSLVRGLAAFRRPDLVLAPLGLTFLSWLAFALSFWLLMQGFHLGLGYDAALLTVIAVNLAMLIPSLPAALGIFEAATVVALSAYGIGSSQALSYAVVLHVLNFLPFVIAGYIVLHRHSLHMRGRAMPPAYEPGPVQAARQAGRR